MGIIYSETNSVESNNSWDVVNTNQNGEVESVEEPAVEEPVGEEPVGEELSVEEPGGEELSATAVEELVVEELAVEELVVEELAVEELAVEELAVEELAVEEESLVKLTSNNLLKKDIQDGIEESLLAMNNCVKYLKNGGINELIELEEYDEDEYDNQPLISVASEPIESDSDSEKSVSDSSDSETEEKPNKRYSKLIKTYYNFKIEVPINIKLCLFMGVLLLAYKSLYCYCE